MADAPTSTDDDPLDPAPVTKLGRPNRKSVLPGQPNADVGQFIIAWVKFEKRKKPNSDLEALTGSAKLIYGGILGATAPEERGEPHAAWLASCTPLQRRLLSVAAKHAKERRKAIERSDYAAAKAAEGLGPVRPYNRNRPDEEKAAMSAAKHKRYRDGKKLAPSKPVDMQVADALDDLLVALPDLGRQRASKEVMAAMSPEERLAHRKRQQAADSKLYRERQKALKGQ